MKLSLCITTYNRCEMTIQAFEKVLHDDRIDDIVIMDDASTDLSYIHLGKKLANNPKVRMYRQPYNKGMGQNKRDAIATARNKWAIIFDSDNIIDTDYLDAFYAYTNYAKGGLEKDFENYIICPDFAKPDFDYTAFSKGGRLYDANLVSKMIYDDSFNCLMNTCNYVVNRDYYLANYVINNNHIATDTIWHNYNHLKSGGILAVAPGMQYFHRVHAGSGFREKIDYNMMRAEEVRKLIKAL